MWWALGSEMRSWRLRIGVVCGKRAKPARLQATAYFSGQALSDGHSSTCLFRASLKMRESPTLCSGPWRLTRMQGFFFTAPPLWGAICTSRCCKRHVDLSVTEPSISGPYPRIRPGESAEPRGLHKLFCHLGVGFATAGDGGTTAAAATAAAHARTAVASGFLPIIKQTLAWIVSIRRGNVSSLCDKILLITTA